MPPPPPPPENNKSAPKRGQAHAELESEEQQGKGQGQRVVLFVLGTDGGVMAVDAVTGHMTAMVRAADTIASGIDIFPLGEWDGHQT